MIDQDLLNKYYMFSRSKNWLEAENILLKIYIKSEKGFWYYTSLSSLKYEQKMYTQALSFSEKAYTINPMSPLVLWDYAVVLYMLDQDKKAIELWKKIIVFGEHRIAHELTSEGIMWARSLINDSRFRLAQAFFYLENDKNALKYMESHLKHRKRGLKSLYGKKEVLSFKSKILGYS